MGTQNYTSYNNVTWIVPANVYIVQVQLWGAGGGGGGGNTTLGGGAGGGGAFAQLNAYSTVPGATHNIQIGRGGNNGAGSANGTNGTLTIFRHANNANAAYADRGVAGRRYNTTAVLGGIIANSSGNLLYAGGNGAGRNGTTGIWAGSGGGSAGNNGNGTAGTNVGANAAGGAGGNGTSNSGGNAALNAVGDGNRPPGGGGAGGGASNQAGGRGGDGLVQISWLDPVSPPFSSTFTYSNGNIQTVSSGNWWTGWNTSFDIDNNQLFCNNIQAGAIFYAPTATVNQYGSIQIISFNNNGADTSSMGLLFRYTTPLNNAYVVFASTSGNNLFVGQSNGTAYNWFSTSPQTHNFNNGDVLAATVFDTGNNVTINVWKNPSNTSPTNWNQWDAGVEAAWTFTGVTSTPIDTGKLLGVGGAGSSGATVRADNWYAGDAPAAPWMSNAVSNATFHDEALGGKLGVKSSNQGMTFGAVSDASVISLISGNATSNATFSVVSDATVTPAPTDAIKLIASTNIANNAATSTTFQLTPPSGKNNTQFTAGKISDDTNPIASISFNNTYTEIEWSIGVGNNVANNSSIEFRVTNNGTAFNNYSQTPTILVQPVFQYIATASDYEVTSDTSMDCDETLNIAEGDLLVSFCGWEDSDTTVSVAASNNSNPFTMTSANNRGGAYAQMGYRIAANASNNATMRATWANAASYKYLFVLQFRPSNGTIVSLDTGPLGNNAGSQTISSAQFSTNSTDEIVVAGHKQYTQNSTFNNFAVGGVAADGYYIEDGGAFCESAAWYKIFNNTQNNIAATCYSVFSDNWVCQALTFRTGAAGNNNQFGNCTDSFTSGLSSTRAANLFATSLVSMGVSGPDSRIATFPVTAFSNATLGSTSTELANLVAILTSTMNLPSTSVSSKNAIASLLSTLTLSSNATNVANLTALLASIVSLHDDTTKLANLTATALTPLSLSSTSSFGSTIQAILDDATSFTSSATRIASFQSIASSVLSITTSSTILKTTGADASQSFNLSSASSRIGTHLASASSPFSLHDTVASSLLFAAIASQSININTTSDWSVLSAFIAFCEETLRFNAADITGLQAVAQLSSAMTTTAGATALGNFVRTASSAFNMPSTSNRAKTLDAALASLISSLTTATERYDGQSSAQATINIASTSTNLATLLNRAIEVFSLGGAADWVGGAVGLLASGMGLSTTALVSRFITAISLSALTFTTTLAPKLTFNVTLDEHVSLHDTIAILRTVATVCAEAFNIRDISYWLSATGAVSVTFHLAKGEITFALTKPSIEARLSKPTIDFD